MSSCGPPFFREYMARDVGDPEGNDTEMEVGMAVGVGVFGCGGWFRCGNSGGRCIVGAGGRTSMLCVSFLPIIFVFIITFLFGGSPLSWIAVAYGALCLTAAFTLTLIWWRVNYRHYNPNPDNAPSP